MWTHPRKAVRSVKEKLRTLFGEANQQLKTLRGDTLGNGTLDDELARRHLDGEQRAFDLLGKTGPTTSGRAISRLWAVSMAIRSSTWARSVAIRAATAAVTSAAACALERKAVQSTL